MRTIWMTRLITTSLAALAAVAWGQVSDAQEVHGVGFKIISALTDGAGNNFCIDASLDPNASNGSYEKVYIYKCHGRENQRFAFTDNDNATTSAIIGHGGKCLDVRGGGTADDTRVQLWRCHYRANQEFVYQGATIKDSHSGKCLAIAQASDRARITIEDCDGRPGEKWRLER